MTDTGSRLPRAESLLLLPAGARNVLASRDAGRARMLIPVAQAQRIIARMHGGGATVEGVVGNRLKYLGRSGFPRWANVSRGQRASFGLEDTLKLAVVFELLALGVATQTATTCVSEEWTDLRDALTEPRTSESSEVPSGVVTPAGPIITMRRDLAGWAVGETDGFRVSGLRRDGRKADAPAGTTSYLSIELGALANRFVDAALAIGGIGEAELREEFELLRADAGRLSNQQATTRQAEPLGSD